LSKCTVVATDSGGLQKEAYFAKKYSILFRSESEWEELVEANYALLCDADPEKISQGLYAQSCRKDDLWPAFYGHGETAREIIDAILVYLQ
jgi:UDP-GlcNAc3NAcA epimerase